MACSCRLLWDVPIEQFATFMVWVEVFSYEIEKIFSDFCFNLNAKWWVQPYSISFSIFFCCCWHFHLHRDISKFGNSRCFFRALWYISFGSLDMALLDENTEIQFSVDAGVCSRMLGAWFDSLWVYSMIKAVIRLKIQIIRVECEVQVTEYFHIALSNYI